MGPWKKDSKELTQIAQVSKLSGDASNKVVIGDIKFDSKICEQTKLSWNGEREVVACHVKLLEACQQTNLCVDGSRKGISSEGELLEVCKRSDLSWELAGKIVGG